jgi:nucleotide-binding universal stress UspA family protein
MFPPRIVLAAVDFSEASRVALNCAARLAKQCGAELHVLHAEDPLLAGAAREAGVDLTRETRDELTAFMQSAAPAGEWAPTQHVVTGPAVDVIRDIAERERADVIVIGMRGMSGVERTMFGSTTEGVLRAADRSVLVVPGSWKPPEPASPDLRGTGPIVVGIELSTRALAATRAAGRLAALFGTSLDAVHVVPLLSVPARWSAHASAALEQHVRQARADITAALHDLSAEFPVRLVVTTGRVADELAAAVAPAAKTHSILILGCRSHDERGGAPGSTAYRVLTMAAVPVLMYLPEG